MAKKADRVAGLMAELERKGIEYLRFELPDMHGMSRSKTVPVDKVESLCAQRPQLLWRRHRASTPRRTWCRGAACTRSRTMPTSSSSPIPNSFRVIPWLDKTASVVCLGYWYDGEPQRSAPRFVYSELVKRGNALGYDVLSATNTSTTCSTRRRRSGSTRASISSIRCATTTRRSSTRWCRRSAPTASISSPTIANMPARNTRPIYGPGRNMAGAGQGLRLQERHEGARAPQRPIASFMAKPFAGHSGSGCHLHISLVDRKTGQNAFSRRQGGERHLGRRRLLRRRHPRACAGDDAAHQPDAQLLPPGQALHIRAVECELGRAGPLGDGAHQGDRRRAHAPRDARRLGGEQSLSARRRRACRRPRRARGARRSSAPQSRDTTSEDNPALEKFPQTLDAALDALEADAGDAPPARRGFRQGLRRRSSASSSPASTAHVRTGK